MPQQPKLLRSIDDLKSAGLISPAQQVAIALVAEHYPVAITPAMISLIDRNDANDPIARQFVPDTRELDQRPEESADPIGDGKHQIVAGLIHRYPDRVLIKLTHACPVYCRFCFRREMVGPGGENSLTADQLDQALAYIGAKKAIWEVILTGGDPFILSPRRIGEITRRLCAIDHLKVLRWHTRVPVVDPARITGTLVAALAAPSKVVYVALHANHPRELTPAARAACARIVDAGIPMVSQSVLLKGINDDPECLAALMRGFVEMRIKPYYLHHADLAPGTSHFRTSIAQGQALMRALRSQLSGLAQPTYVLDIPGGYAKVPIGPDYIDTDGHVRDPSGRPHDYPERG
jgi:lysine 2,3-aminomutase